jgi:hypothetical protein
LEPFIIPIGEGKLAKVDTKSIHPE